MRATIRYRAVTIPVSHLPPSLACLGTSQGPDAAWQRLTEAGNAALARGEASIARADYEAALSEAGDLLLRARDDLATLIVAPMALNISLSNLAELHRRVDDLHGAARLERQAVERLTAIAKDVGEDAALRLNCVRHLRYALAFATDVVVDPALRAELATLTAEALRVMEEVPRQLRALVVASGAGSATPTQH